MSTMKRFFEGEIPAPARIKPARILRYLLLGLSAFAGITAFSEKADATVTLRKGLDSNPLKTQAARNYLSYEDCLLRGDSQYEFDASVNVDRIYLGIQSNYECILPDGTQNSENFNINCVELKSADLSDAKFPKISVHNLVEAYASLTSVDAALCLDTAADAKPHREMRLFFVLTDNTVDVWDEAKFDLAGPDAPSVKSVSSDENMLSVTYSVNDNDAKFVHVFCEPVSYSSANNGSSSGTSGSSGGGTGGGAMGAGGAGGTGGAGGSAMGAGGAGGSAMGTAGAGGSTTGSSSSGGTSGSSGTCNPIVLTQDLGLTENDAGTAISGLPYLQTALNRDGLTKSNLCAAIQEHTASRTNVLATHYVYVDNAPDANKLKNGQDYLIRIAIRDEAGNFGTLSEPKCGTPEDLYTFTDELTNAGAKAGGGYCQCTFLFNSDVLPIYSYGGAAAALALWYRRRSRTAKKPGARRPS